MNLVDFQRINVERGRRWHQGDLTQWTPLEWAGAANGEAGEMMTEVLALAVAVGAKIGAAANAAKKIRRITLELPNREAGTPVTELDALRRAVSKESADAIIYALLLISLMGDDASTVIANVFDQKSIEYGFPERAPLSVSLDAVWVAAQEFANTVATTRRINTDIHCDGREFTTVTEVVLHAFRKGAEFGRGHGTIPT